MHVEDWDDMQIWITIMMTYIGMRQRW